MWEPFTSNDEEKPPKDDKKNRKKPNLRDLLDEDEDGELQEQINEMISKRLARERRKSGRRDDDDEGQTAKELEELREFKKAQEQAEAVRKGEFDKALNTEKERFATREGAWKKREDTLTKELRKERIRGKLEKAAARHGAIDPGEIADMLERRVALDDNFEAYVVDEKDPTKRAINGEGDDLDIDGLVESYATKKKHLFKAVDGEGTGSRGGRSTDAEGAKGGNGKDRKSTDLSAAEKDLEEANKLAESNPSTGNLTMLRKAERRVRELQQAAK